MRALLPWLVWWLVMAGFMGLTRWLAGGEMPSPALVAGLTVSNTLFMGLVEQLLPRRPDSDLLHDPQSPRDLAHGMALVFFARPLSAAAALVLVAWAAPLLPAAACWPRHVPMALQVALVLLLWSLLSYWTHRAFHAFEPLWRFHAIHHDTTGHFHLLKAGRVHFGEELMRYGLVLVPLLLLGVPGEALIWLGLWNLYEGNLAHSNLDQRMPRFAHRLFNTLQVHTLHHGAGLEQQPSNYAGVTPLWDQPFGTFRHPDDHPVEAVGLGQETLPSTLRGQLLHPFRVRRDGTSPA